VRVSLRRAPRAGNRGAPRRRVAIDVAAIAAECRRRAAEVDVLLVEGAGGLLVPLGEGTSFADLAAALSAELVIVVGARLGAINHALLTIEAARARGLTVLGLVVNHFSATRDLATDTLRAALEEHAAVPFLAEVRYGEEATAALARAAAALTGARA
jgi:dethiobiotin synthetase